MSKYFPIGAIIAFIIFVIIEINSGLVGILINVFFPCKQNPLNSAPCSAGYSIGSFLFFLFSLLIIFITYYFKQKK